MSRIKFRRPGQPVAQPTVERVIQIGRRQVGKYPERLDYFVVSHTSPAGDAAGNRAIDEELCARLLEDQRQHAPDLPPDKLRSIRVFLAPAQGGCAPGAFESEYRCRTEDGYVICRGDGDRAQWLRGVDDAGTLRPQPPCLRLAASLGAEDPSAVVECPGEDCPYYRRTTPDGKKPLYPRCEGEYSFAVQIMLLESVLGVARFRSSSSVGLGDADGTLTTISDLVESGRIKSAAAVPLQLRLKNTTNQHGKAGAWSACFYVPGTALTMIEAAEQAYEGGRQLGAAAVPRPAAYLEAATAEAVEAGPAVADPDPEKEPAKTAEPVTPDDDGSVNCWDRLRDLAADLAGDDDVARAALKRVIAEAADLGLPPWRKTDGAIWMMTGSELEHAEIALEEAVVAMAEAAAQAKAEEATS